MAAGRSIHEETSDRGGDSGIYQQLGQLKPSLAAAVSLLDVGQVSQPFSMSYDRRTVFVVAKVLDEMPVPLEAAAPRIRKELKAQKSRERHQTLLDSLLEAYDPQPRPETLDLLSQLARTAAPGEIDLPEDTAAEELAARYTIRSGVAQRGGRLRQNKYRYYPGHLRKSPGPGHRPGGRAHPSGGGIFGIQARGAGRGAGETL